VEAGAEGEGGGEVVDAAGDVGADQPVGEAVEGGLGALGDVREGERGIGQVGEDLGGESGGRVERSGRLRGAGRDHWRGGRGEGGCGRRGVGRCRVDRERWHGWVPRAWRRWSAEGAWAWNAGA
jgi:hypothetical protein